MNLVNTWAGQFIMAYRLAKEGKAEQIRKSLEDRRAFLLAQENGAEGIEAVETGLDAFEMGMSEENALSWARGILNKESA